MYKVMVFGVVGVISAIAAAGAVLAIDQKFERRPLLAATATSPEPAAAEGSAASITKAADGHYWAEGLVDGKRVRFLVDTGATVVALTLDDARRLGLADDLTFNLEVKTAAGAARAARVKLSTVSVAGAPVQNVDAIVMENGLPSSLLGMAYLGRLSRFEATPAALILRP